MKSMIRIGLLALCAGSLLSGCAAKSGGPQAGNTTTHPPAHSGPPGDSSIQSPREDSWTFDSDPTPAPSVRPKRRLNEIAFAANSTELSSEGSGVCREASKMLKESPALKILLLGYCHKDENVGSGSNDLGLRRAEKVKACLKANGVNVSGFETASFGSRYSTADRTAPMTMKQERRVEMWVLAP